MQKKRVSHRGARIGDMRHRITIHTRDITSPAHGSIDFSETFTGTNKWAAIKTLQGVTVFDGVSQDANVTHEISIRYDSSVTSETFIQLDDGRRLKILDVMHYEERDDYMVLLCTDRGLDEAAKA